MYSKYELQKAIVLNTGENVAHSWEGNSETKYKIMKGKYQLITVGGHRGRDYQEKEGKKITSGTLVLTNQRLLWFERRGFLSKAQRASFDIDLKSILGITLGGVINKWVSITDGEKESVFHLRGVGNKEIEPFRDMILRQVENLKKGL